MSSVKFDKVTAFQDCVLTYSDKLFSRLFCENNIFDVATVHEGVKGKHVITEALIGDLAKRWLCKFECEPDVIEFCPRVIETARNKIDLCFCPGEYEKNYLGWARKKGQDSRDWPFERYVLDLILKKVAEEIQYAYWQAEESATPMTNDKMINTFNGICAIIEQALADGDITVTAPLESLVDTLEAMYCAFDDCHKENAGDIVFYMEHALYQTYFTQYREAFGKYCCKNDFGDIMLDMGAKIIPISGLRGTNKIIGTFQGNLHYAYDARDDHKMINIQQDKRNLCLWMDFRIGAQIGLVNPECLQVSQYTPAKLAGPVK